MISLRRWKIGFYLAEYPSAVGKDSIADGEESPVARAVEGFDGRTSSDDGAIDESQLLLGQRKGPFNWSKKSMKNYLSIFLLFGALFSTSLLSAQKPAVPFPTALSESLYTNRDSMTYYASLSDQGDARGQFVMASSYFYALGRPVPDGVPRIYTRVEALSLLRQSAKQGYEPALNLERCILMFCSEEEVKAAGYELPKGESKGAPKKQ